MLYEFKGELSEDFIYWCNCTGDLNHVDDVAELRPELQRAYNVLWNENYWANCYVVEFNNKYGVALEAEYDNDFAKDIGISYKELLDKAKSKAATCADRYPKYDVIFGEDTMKWSDGSVDSIVSIIVPWDASEDEVEDVAKWLDSMCYDF